MVSMATDSSHSVIMGQWCCHFFSAVFDRIFFILAGNEDMHKNSQEFDVRPDRTTDSGFRCP